MWQSFLFLQKRYFLTKEHTFLRIFAFDNEQFMRYNSSIKVFFIYFVISFGGFAKFYISFLQQNTSISGKSQEIFPAFLLFLRHKTLACYVVGVRVRTFTQF